MAGTQTAGGRVQEGEVREITGSPHCSIVLATDNTPGLGICPADRYQMMCCGHFNLNFLIIMGLSVSLLIILKAQKV